MLILIQPYHDKPTGQVHRAKWNTFLFAKPTQTECGHDLKEAKVWNGSHREVTCKKCGGRR